MNKYINLDKYNLSKIRAEGHYDHLGTLIEVYCEWVGQTPFVAVSYEFLKEADHALVKFPGDAQNLEKGDIVQLCTYSLQVIENDDLSMFVVLERLSGQDGAITCGERHD